MIVHLLCIEMDQRSNWPIWSFILVPDPEFALQHSYSNVLIARCRVLVRADNPEAPLPPLRATTLRQVQHKGKKDFLFLLLFWGAPVAYIGSGPLNFTVFSYTAFTFNLWMVNHPSTNRGPSCWTSVFIRELGNWYRRSWIFIIFFLLRAHQTLQ